VINTVKAAEFFADQRAGTVSERSF
jgi:hypothetical protein